MKTTEQTLQLLTRLAQEIDENVALKIEIDWDKMATRMQTGLNRIKAQTKKDLEEVESKMIQLTDRVMNEVLEDISTPRKRSRYLGYNGR